MDCLELSQEGNTLRVKFNCTELNMMRNKSSKYICGALYTEFEFTTYGILRVFNLTVSVRFQKLLDDDDFIYTCKLMESNNTLLVRELKVCDDHWHQIACVPNINNQQTNTFEVTLNCEISEGRGVFTSIYDDTKSTDFKLCGDGGSVPVHKIILSAHSPVLQAMLENEWKESQEGRVALPGVSLETIQQLKDYMYLNRLPETGLQELCALAAYYMIERLVVQCCSKLLNYLTTDNAIEFIEFASKYRLSPFLVAVITTMTGAKPKIDKQALKTNWPAICNKNNTTEYADDNNVE